ncbi:MAG: 23S rRNA (pseudouridine(1915)-N(3))-methyltransferase RlmH [Patescibacteria group bacterium]
MTITVITISGVKNKTILPLIAEYVKRISRYSKIQVLDIKEEKRENHIINIKHAYPSSYIFALDEEGKTYTSDSFAKHIEHIQTHISSNIIFVIGPSAGFSVEELKTANQKLSLSSLTFPHELATMLVCEQVYRALTILNNHPYHKE